MGLQRALRDGGAVAVVSGRSIAVIDTFLDPLHLPAAGVHGNAHMAHVGSRAAALARVIAANTRALVLVQ